MLDINGRKSTAMVISHKYKFIFVKTAKTAGTSIEIFLSRHCAASDILTPISPHVEPHVARNYEGYFNHIPAHQIRDRLDSDTWNSYFKFCVERNPWDKMLSFYHRQKSIQGNELTFEQCLAQNRFPLNYPKYTEPTDPNKIIVDKILCFEHLMQDLDELFKELNIPFLGSLGVKAKSEYRTDHRSYRDIYTTKQAILVGDFFKQEIFLHGYRF